MDLKAEQCWTRAACYERIADDESAPKEVRLQFAHQANLLRIMGKLAELDDIKRVSQQVHSCTNPA
jgi:hypothetical protein